MKTKKMTTNNVQIWKPVPDFHATAVLDGTIKELKLSGYKEKYVVLFFYPLDFIFVCPVGIISFSDWAEEFRKIKLIAASVDFLFTHLAWINTQRKDGCFSFPIIPLVSHNVCKNFGMLKEHEGITYRGLLITDDKGIVQQITVNDLPMGHPVDETLYLVQAFQFTDQHGKVCPASWQSGGDIIKPTVKDSKIFFAKKQ